MGLKSTRKILSSILCVILALSTIIFCASAVISLTFAKQSFYEKHFVSDALVTECEKQLDAKFEALEKKSSIPARVFQTVKKDYDTMEALNRAVTYIFNEQDETLYNDSTIEYFYKLCVEYLKGNNIDYNKEYVQNVAQEAAKIYSDSVGIHNAELVSNYIARLNRNCTKICSAVLLIAAAAVILVSAMYKDKLRAYSLCTGAVASGGAATFLASLLSIIFKTGLYDGILPSVYQQAVLSITRLCFVYLLVLGIIILICSYISFAIIKFRTNREQNRKDTRFSKIIGKI